MELKLVRNSSIQGATTGRLSVDGTHECYTCEDVVREVKVPGKTAIPPGTYNVIINYSNRFKRQMPLLLEVPNFSGIRIHPGNTAEDTEGCILVGQTMSVNSVGASRKAYTKLFEKMLLATEPITITIE